MYCTCDFPSPSILAVTSLVVKPDFVPSYRTTGRFPFKVEEVLRTYGDVVRIGPNELVFITPEAATDIYGAHTKHMEHFIKTDMFDLNGGFDGVTWERNPELHRERLKKLSPAFSTKSLSAKEPTMHKYIDLFVESMREVGCVDEGIELRKVQ